MESIKKSIRQNQSAQMERVSDFLHIPKELTKGATVFTIMGNMEMVVENYKSILEYTDESIRIQGKYQIVTIEGKHLLVDYFTNDDMKVKGKITHISFQ